MITNRREFLKTIGNTTACLTVGVYPMMSETTLLHKWNTSTGKATVHSKNEDFPIKINRIKLTDHGQTLINPGMGWVTYFYSNLYQNYGSKLEPSDTVRYFPGMNTVFL